MHLIDLLFPPRVDEALLRTVSAEEFLSLLSPQLVVDTHPETVTLFPFSNPHIRSAIHEAKYHGSEYAFTLLSLALIEYLHDADMEFRKPTLVPIPLGATRLKERGFNQTEEVAKRAAAQLGSMIDTSLLLRTRETPSQVSLPREKREENMRGAFGAAHPADPTYTYILLDDVITTGATLQAATDALKAAGAVHIVPLALAH